MRKRLVYRADDIGYTLAFDLGIYRAFEEGIATSADVMFDSQHTVEALKWLKERPWISIGWHRHLWGWPVAGAENVPSMVNEQGKFKWRFDQSLQNTVTYDDAYREFEAELALVKDVYGRYPDSAYVRPQTNELERAYKDILEKYDIPRNFWTDSPKSAAQTDEKYKSLHFNAWNDKKNPDARLVDKHIRYDLADFKNFDPLARIKQVEWESEDEIWRVGGHPGYVDDYILSESTHNIHRPKELQACIAAKEWVIENKVELISQRDVFYGTNEFQDHLKEINSPLWIGNM